VVWQKRHVRHCCLLDAQFDVVARRFAADGAPLGEEFLVGPPTGFSKEAPAITSDAAGNFVVVWGARWPQWDAPATGIRG
jgi:hypothetical protein